MIIGKIKWEHEQYNRQHFEKVLWEIFEHN